MRDRQRILSSLESVYRQGYADARERQDQERMSRLDFEFQRDQIYLEALLDVRDLLLPQVVEPEPGEGVASLLEKAQKLRALTRLR